MANFLYVTKGNAPPKGKPRVYFTCHPEDFDKYFKKVCDDIFKSHDCAIFYTESMTEEIEESYKESDLGQMNLFVIPVTFKLLNQPNRAMDSDFRYAQEKRIPVLPIMMEQNLDTIYSRKDKFGEAQYLDPNATDMTAISYEEKLKKYLESVLISDEMAERVRKAFDAYVFLSYRKKDRHYANELMKMIHNYPEYRDIAIWYDEFLTPGESFKENIERMMKDSKLFALLVTPRLLEYVDGKPNYVMEHEYPDAKAANMSILPTEMEETDQDELRSKYDGIPDCVRPAENEIFRKRLADTLSNIAISENNDNPEHNFLIGLAYLEGIDVEVDKDRALELITSTAEAGLIEAIAKLYDMYENGTHVNLSYPEAIKWGKKYAEYYANEFGEDSAEALDALDTLSLTYSNNGQYREALELQERVYRKRCELFGEDHHSTLITLYHITLTYRSLGNFDKALDLAKKVYQLRCKVLGENHLYTLMAFGIMVSILRDLGKYNQALDLQNKLYEEQCKSLGTEHPRTLVTLHNIAITYQSLGDYNKALEIIDRVYRTRCEVLGENHSDTLTALEFIAILYCPLKNFTKALELETQVYQTRCKVLGENHLDTLSTLDRIATILINLENYKPVLELQNMIYEALCKLLGHDHPKVLAILNNIAYTYRKLEDFSKALEVVERVYRTSCEMLGDNHHNTLTALANMAIILGELGDYERALELEIKVYKTRCETLGHNHPDTLVTLNNISCIYYSLGDYNKSLDIAKLNFRISYEVFGENHPYTLQALDNINNILKNLESH